VEFRKLFALSSQSGLGSRYRCIGYRHRHSLLPKYTGKATGHCQL
jgi:hypothetical protein